MIDIGTTLADDNVYAGRYFSLRKGWIYIVAELYDITNSLYKANVSEAEDIGKKRGTRVPNVRELKILYKNKDKIGNFTDDTYYISSESTMYYSAVGWPLGIRNFAIYFCTGRKTFAAGTGTHSRGDCRLVRTVTKEELEALI